MQNLRPSPSQSDRVPTPDQGSQRSWYPPGHQGDLFIPQHSSTVSEFQWSQNSSNRPEFQHPMPYAPPNAFYHASSSAPSPAPSPQHAAFKLPNIQPIMTTTRSTIRSGNWTDSERDMLLAWLGKDAANHRSYKINMRRTLEKISQEVFGKQRTVDSIRTQWDSMKKKYQNARDRLNSTGEGQQNDTEKWSNIKLAWLNKLCPFFDQIDEILQKDKAITPPYASESGGPAHIEERDSQLEVEINDTFLSLEDHDDELDNTLHLEEEVDDQDVLHPPAGGRKNPKRKSAPDSPSTTRGSKGLKRQRPNAVQEITERLHNDRMDIEERRLKLEQVRDDRQYKLALEREKTIRERDQRRHEENAQRMKLSELKMKVQLATLLRGENGKELASLVGNLYNKGSEKEQTSEDS